MTSAAPDGHIVVAYGRGAAGPIEIARAADGRWRVVFLFRSDDAHAQPLAPLMRSLGETIDVNAMSRRDLIARLRALPVHGVTTFCETMLGLVADLADQLGCTANPASSVAALTDKRLQRAALNAAGVSPTRAAALSASSVAEAITVVGLPAVLKRARAAQSRVHIVESAKQIRALLSAGEGDFLLEELLCGAPRQDGEPWLGDYVSVESYVVGGAVHHLCITDKLPLASQFLEVGAVLPSTVEGALREAILDLTKRAIGALGVATGMTHTEVKLTEHGPRIIEVNGRLGGFVQRLVRRATDVNPVALALELAAEASPTRDDVAFRCHVGTVFVVPAPEARIIRQLAPRSALRRVDGVWNVEAHRRAGDALAPNDFPRLQTIDVEADSRDELARRLDQVIDLAYGAARFD